MTAWHRILCPRCGRTFTRTGAPYTGLVLNYCRSSVCKCFRELYLIGGVLQAQREHKDITGIETADMLTGSRLDQSTVPV